MGIAKKTDGRYVVGVGVDNANDYRGSAAYRDIYIQLTSSGATEQSEEYLTFLKDYAVNANALGEPIMPPSVNVWISNNGVTTAVEADDVSIDGNNYTICGIKWNGSTWDYSGAGQGKSGSGLPPYTSADKGKFLGLGEGSSSTTEVIVPEQSVEIRNMGDDEVSIYMGVVSSVNVSGLSGLADGATVVFSFNGNEYDTTYDKANNECYGDDIYLQYSNRRDEWELTVPTVTEGNYTVSAYTSVPSVEPKWEAASGGGIVVYASGMGVYDESENVVSVPLTINRTEFSACFVPGSFKPIVIFAPTADINNEQYWTYERGVYVAYPYTNVETNRFNIGDDFSASLYFDDNGNGWLVYPINIIGD